MQYVMVSMSVFDYELLTYALSVDSIVQPCTLCILPSALLSVSEIC